jgi:hypothetical protein
MSKLAIALVGAFLFSSQSYAWDKMEGVGKAEAKGVITVTAAWIKDKKDKYDVNLKLTNDSAKTILMFVGDTKCGRGGDMGGKVDIHSDRRSIDLRNGESRDLVLTCRFEDKKTGDFAITFKIFDNPSNDSNTPGKVLADKLTWKQGEKAGKIL